MNTQYKGVAAILKLYWTSYGGLGALVGSPYLHAAIVLLVFTFPTWSGFRCETTQCANWWEQGISVLPSLLGFTLGGFAMFMGFGDEKFRALLAAEDEEAAEGKLTVNPYVALCSTFVHFILVQALALLAAIIAKAWWFYTPWVDPIRPLLPTLNFIGGAFGYGLFLYTLTSLIAATMHIFRIAHMYARFQAMHNN